MEALSPHNNGRSTESSRSRGSRMSLSEVHGQRYALVDGRRVPVFDSDEVVERAGGTGRFQWLKEFLPCSMTSMSTFLVTSRT